MILIIRSNKTFILLFCIFLPLKGGILDKAKNLYYGSNEPQAKSQEHVIYSHGFGERALAGKGYTGLFENASYAAPEYENELNQASFYTQESQKKLLKKLVEAEKEGKSGLFVGRSMGGGTGINLLDKLIDYEKNKDFFKDTDIKSPQDAQKIIDSINKGKVIFTAPALSMRETTAIRMPSSLLSAATFAGLTAEAYYLWSSYRKRKAAEQKAADEKKTDKTEEEKKSKEESISESVAQEQSSRTERIKEILTKVGIVGLGGAGWYLFGEAVSREYATGLVNYGLAWVTGRHFNPADTEPKEALKRIITSGKYTAPTLWHFNKNDEILHHPEEKIRKLFEGKNPSHEVIFTDDASHNVISQQYLEKVKEFYKE